MRIRELFTTILLAIPAAASGGLIEELEARATESVATPAGKAYEPGAIHEFWGDAQFMRLCVPAEAPAEKLTVFVEILENGAIGQLAVTPKTMAGVCIAEKVSGRRFSKPPGKFVLRVNINIRQKKKNEIR